MAGLHYGDNVAFEEAGRYRVVVTIAASPLTGTDGDERCEFVLDFEKDVQAGEPVPAG
ncbi:MAG TPA: iron transporter [Mycobacterium sp.]|nr:iron transporter [Mycobacterium sp.]